MILKFRKEKNNKFWQKYLNSPEIIKEYDNKIDAIITCLNKISDNTEHIQVVRDLYNVLIKAKLI